MSEVVKYSPFGYNVELACSSEPRCKCYPSGKGQFKADCSSLDLQEFPEFSEYVEEIIFFNNSLHAINANDTLPERLTHLDISACELKSIHRGFLQKFSRLEYLDLSYNRELSLEVLPNISYDLQFTSIKVLKAEAIQCKYGKGLIFKNKYVYYFRNTSLEEVNLSNNRIEIMERFVFYNAPDSLRRLTVTDNQLVFSWAVLDIPYLKNVEYVDLSRQWKKSNSFLSFVENTCNDSTSYVNNDIHGWRNTNSYPFQETKNQSSVSMESCLSDIITIPPSGKVNVYICLQKPENDNSRIQRVRRYACTVSSSCNI